jgi:hypothetical protein
MSRMCRERIALSWVVMAVLETPAISYSSLVASLGSQ